MANMRIDDGVKVNLEQIRDISFRVDTHSDAVEKLIQYYRRMEEEKIKETEARRLEKERRGREDVTLGVKRKQCLIQLKQLLELPDLNDVVDVLLMHFENTDQVCKDVLLHILKRRVNTK